MLIRVMRLSFLLPRLGPGFEVAELLGCGSTHCVGNCPYCNAGHPGEQEHYGDARDQPIIGRPLRWLMWQLAADDLSIEVRYALYLGDHPQHDYEHNCHHEDGGSRKTAPGLSNHDSSDL